MNMNETSAVCVCMLAATFPFVCSTLVAIVYVQLKDANDNNDERKRDEQHTLTKLSPRKRNFIRCVSVCVCMDWVGLQRCAPNVQFLGAISFLQVHEKNMVYETKALSWIVCIEQNRAKTKSIKNFNCFSRCMAYVLICVCAK